MRPSSNERQKNQHIDSELIPKLALFIIAPFFTFLYSLRRANSFSSYVIYFLFGAIFCWHLDSTGLGHYDDLIGILERFRTFNYNTNEVLQIIYDYFSFSGNGEKEIYEIILMWFTKLFSNNPHTYFFLASIPFLIFYLKSLKYITADEKFDNGVICLLIMLLFVLPRDIITIQNPRYATAMWLAVFATLRYFTTKKNNAIYFLLILTTVLIHSAFWFYVIVFISGLFMIKYPNILYKVLIISIPISFLSVDLISAVSLESLPLPSNLIRWASFHFNEENFQNEILGANGSGFFWVGQFFALFRQVTYACIPIILWKYRQEINERTDGIRPLFYFYIFYFAIVDLIQSIPVLGARTYFISRILSILLWFKIVYPRRNKFLLLLLASCAWEIFQRYFYTGAVYTSVPLNIIYTPLPMLIIDYLGVE